MAQVRLFSDANRVKTSAKQTSLYLLDEQGRHYPLIPAASAIPVDVTLGPGQSVFTSLAFVAAANTRKLYLTRDYPAMPWAQLYFGSDISLFHRRTLLRVL